MIPRYPSPRALPLAARCVVLCAMGVAAGCGTSPKEQEGGGEEISIKRVAADTLPDLAEYLPPQDDGRIEIPGPKDWQRLPRELKYLARYVKGDRLGLPRILVTVDPSDFESFDTVNEENVTEFSAETAKRLKDRKAALLETPRPMVIGPHAFTRYVLRSKFRDANIERQMLQTIVAGRLYTVDLQVDDGDLVTNSDLRDAAYSVAAGLKFHAGKASAAPSEPSSDKEPAKE